MPRSLRSRAAKLRQLGIDLEFPEVAIVEVDASVLGAWQYDQNTQELEERALVMSFRRVALSLHGRDARQILIVDNLGVWFDRCRSKNFELLHQLRVFASYVLGRYLKPTVRWGPSEFKNSDVPSRRCDPFPPVFPFC